MGGHNKTRQQHAAPPSNPKVSHMNESGWSEQVGGLDREPIVKRRLGRGDTKRKPVINGTTAAPLFSQMKIRDVGTRATGTTEQNEKKIFLSVTVGISCNIFFSCGNLKRRKRRNIFNPFGLGSENKATPKPRGGKAQELK